MKKSITNQPCNAATKTDFKNKNKIKLQFIIQFEANQSVNLHKSKISLVKNYVMKGEC